ncbi:hypothetical protein BC628DRAFT_1413007 [Trametes gibbosa]|nr:hypothetical protein BC628DRAFT_1413007 [Trametes gibbosa]
MLSRRHRSSPSISSTATPATIASTPRLMLPPVSTSKSLPMATSSSVALPPSAFTALPPSAVKTVVADPSALILDIRPHNAYVQARIPNALSLSVPSTLLKRPLFSLSKLADMLPTSSAREKFSKWPDASRILVYDTDSASIPQQTQASNILGLMRKFRNEGFPQEREVAWLRGGFHAIWRELPEIVNHETPPEEIEDDEMEVELDAPLRKTMSAPPAARTLRAKQLPKDAFTSATTIPLRPRMMPPPMSLPIQLVPPTPAMPRTDPLVKASIVPSTPATESLPSLPNPQASGDFRLRLPQGLVPPKTASGVPVPVPRGPLYSMPTLSPHYTHSGAYSGTASYSVPGRQVAFNPFFDTIRQNIELGSRDSKAVDGAGIPLKLSKRVRRRVGELPFEWLREIARKSRRAADASSTSEESDDSTDSDCGPADETRRSRPATTPSTVKSNPSSNSLKFDPMARRSPPKSRSSSPSLPVVIPLSLRSRSRQHRSASSPSSPTGSSHSRSPPDADDLTRVLEHQFYNIELGEQKRLLGVMERHSLESGKVIQEGGGVRGVLGTTPQSRAVQGKASAGTSSVGVAEAPAACVGEEAITSFPYSITAGLEKGAKNRYRNIWPFEHARVRLRKAKPDDDDYMNASYVQPLGTTKRYIATQGPLPATFADFWTLCWEQNVHVIVMLTREIEGSSIKCGKYWEEGTYGSLRLRLVETNDTPEREQKRRDSEISSGFFSAHVQKAKAKPVSEVRKVSGEKQNEDDVSTIKRVFELTNAAYPLAPPRIVTQFQYLEWPDLNVPTDPHGVLSLIRQVEDTVERSRAQGQKRWGEGPLYRKSHDHQPSPEEPASQSRITILDGPNQNIDSIDPLTGVSLVARENAPVLLHCSAGVGRTGGFIAVDAVLDGVRREMRKRREGKVSETATAKAASTFGQGRSGTIDSVGSASESQSRSRSASFSSPTPDPMEVDCSPSPQVLLAEGSLLTAPVVAGDREVHVPVAGSAGATLMDVDDRQAGATTHAGITHPVVAPEPMRTTVPLPFLQASPELVNEVKRAALRTLPEVYSQTAPISATPSFLQKNRNLHLDTSTVTSEASSDSTTAHSGTTVNTTSHSSVSPPISSKDSVTSAMVGRTARLTMASPSPPTKQTSLPRNEGVAVQCDAPASSSTSSTSSTSAARTGRDPQGAHHARSRPSSHSIRLNTWRSEVQSSDIAQVGTFASNSAPRFPQLDPDNIAKQAVDVATRAGPPTPDLKEPRRLHDDSSPPLLSSYEDPIRRVIEDMREQRMSLCQSLRQYVFVHRAIIEGALMIVDEQKRREAKVKVVAGDSRTGQARLSQLRTAEHKSSASVPVDRVQNMANTGLQGAVHTVSLGSPFVASDSEREVSRKRSFPEFLAGSTIVEGVVSPASVASAGRPKRVGSPAELTKEDIDGGVLLTKRPSVKRRQRLSDVGGQRPQFDGVLLSSRSSPDAQ